MISVNAPASHYQTPIARFGIRLFSVLLFVVGIGMAIPQGRRVLDARASRGWPTVPGNVRESYVEESVTIAKPKTYKPCVTYNYVWGNQAYVGDDVTFNDVGLKDRSVADAVVARYPVGAAVKVYCKPSDPQIAVLEPGASVGVYLILLLSPLMVVLGVLGWRASGRQHPAPTERQAQPAARVARSRLSFPYGAPAPCYKSTRICNRLGGWSLPQSRLAL